MNASLLRRPAFWLYLLLLVGLLRGLFFVLNLHAPLSPGDQDHYLVPAGRSLTAVVADLEARGILSHPFDLLVFARLSGRSEIRAGEYALTAEMNALDLLDKLVRGEVVYHRVVLVEGWTAAQALAALQRDPRIESTLPAADAEALQRALDLEHHPEGQFFPDTYLFTRGTSDREILLRAHALMRQVLREEWQARALGLPYSEPYEALIMASLVEKETGMAAERARIAGVFVRRLQQGMRLQTDPTVIYGLGAAFDGDLRRADLRSDTPYNTYTRHGLPPTPIALPGRDAIRASLHPADGDSLYFVSRGDGSHQFSATLPEHNAAVRRYQLQEAGENPSEVYEPSP